MLAYLDTLIGFAVIMLGASLLITILTQMASAVFSHRGANLRWGLETMFQNIPNCPIMKGNARMIAEDILTHHLISDSIFSGQTWMAGRMKLATAVSPDELATILKDLAMRYAAAVPPHPLPTGVAGAALGTEINTLLLSQNPAADRRIQLLTGAPALAAVAAIPALVAPLVEKTVSSMRDAAGELDAWFGATMDRVSTRFTTYARIWTMAFAIVFAGVTGMNCVAVLSDLYSSSDLRQQMVGAAPEMMGLTEKVMTGAKTPQEAVQSAMTGMYTAAVAQSLTDGKATADTKPDGIQTEADGKAWITAHVTDAAQQAATLAAFPKEIDIASKALIEQRAKDAATVRSLLSNSKFDVLQVRWGTKNAPKLPEELAGILATAALLSLGAPFWFNLLKSLTNLRPLVANKQDPATK